MANKVESFEETRRRRRDKAYINDILDEHKANRANWIKRLIVKIQKRNKNKNRT